jgi:hypothetical protein
VKTLEGLAVDFPTLGWLAASWIEHYCVRGPGPVQGTPLSGAEDALPLTDEDVTFLCWLYRLYPPGHELAGKRVATDADLSAPKGWAKSELAGFVVLWEAFGPCRFAGWATAGQEPTHWGYQFDVGEPVGRVLLYPFIRCLATEEEQSGNTYRNVKYVLEHGERIGRRLLLRRRPDPHVHPGARRRRDPPLHQRRRLQGRRPGDADRLRRDAPLPAGAQGHVRHRRAQLPQARDGRTAAPAHHDRLLAR